MPNTARSVAKTTGVATLTAAAAFSLFIGFLQEREGTVYKAYLDSVGVLTICTGDTSDVRSGMIETKEGCEKRLTKQAQKAWDAADEIVTADMTPYQQWAYADYIYNAGRGNFATSSMLRYANQGRVQESCDSFLLHFKAGGRDCRIRSNNCYGVWDRRQAERRICLGDIG